jgi:four helix bundle protein
MIHNFKELRVWQDAMDLAKMIYQITVSFPQEEKYGLTSQMRRAAVSIPSNIAEGHTRHSTDDFINFISISIGSLNELETQLLLSETLNFTNEQQASPLKSLIDSLHKSLRALRTSLKNKP